MSCEQDYGQNWRRERYPWAAERSGTSAEAVATGVLKWAAVGPVVAFAKGQLASLLASV